MAICDFASFLGIDMSSFRLQLPWALSTVPYAIFMIVIGSKMRNCKLLEFSSPRQLLVIVLISALIVALLSHFWMLDMFLNRILPIFPQTIAALVGTYMVFSLSKLIDKAKVKNPIIAFIPRILQIVGKETFIVVAFSQLIIRMINEYFILNSIIKYLVLVVILCLLGVVKNKIVKLLCIVQTK